MRELLRTTNAFRTLSADAAQGTLSHAVLVVFPDAVYLRDLLKECAKAIFQAEDGSRAGTLIGEEHFPDCIFVPAEGEKLSVDGCGRIVTESALRPVEGDKKLFVLDRMDQAPPLVQTLVQNKLLKLLEEPPEGVYFLLGAVSEYSMLPTVLSRVKRLSVPPFSPEQIASALRKKRGDAEGIGEAAAACGGILSAAEDLLGGGGESVAQAEKILLGEDVPAICRSLSDRKAAAMLLSSARSLLRDVAFVHSKAGAFAARGKRAKALAKSIPVGAALAGISLTERAERELSLNANASQCVLAFSIAFEKEKTSWRK